jgi:hypothetical protein
VTEADLVRALRPVADAFDALGIRYFLGGSVAISAHGVARASLDVDVVAELEPGLVDRFARRLEGGYYMPLDQMRAAAVERRSFNLIHLPTMFKIDVFVSKGRPFDRSAADRAKRFTIGEGPDCQFPVASLEDTVLAKLEWFRLGGETSERQWWDIIGVLRVGVVADRAYLGRWATVLGVADLLERAFADARG